MRFFGLNHDKKRRRGFLDRLVQDNPQFHAHQGQPTSWAPHVDTLRFLFSQLSPSMTTLETGCGQTTVVFAIAGTRHVSVMPGRERHVRAGELGHRAGEERARAGCARRGLHRRRARFPAPVLDWHYTARKLRTGVVFQDHSARGFSETFRHPGGLESSSYGLKVCVSKSFLV
jgi:hypothetical protein